jgi:hypothetical protein
MFIAAFMLIKWHVLYVLYRWKHAAQCHKGSAIEGETDIHVEDDLSRAILAATKAPPLSLSPSN